MVCLFSVTDHLNIPKFSCVKYYNKDQNII